MDTFNITNQLNFNNIEYNKTSIIVPVGIRYIGNWSNYSLNLFPFKHILDKKIPGCGYTEYCLTCDIPVILCSPRLMLLQNKLDQHGDSLFYYRNPEAREIFVDKDLTKINRGSAPRELTEEEKKEKEERIKESIAKLNTNLKLYLGRCELEGRVPKIIVTYDSFRVLKDYLTFIEAINNFHIVIDEFQSIFTDSKFKSDTELTFVNQLQDLDKVCYVSATPMIDKYLKELDEFKDLPYFELDWETEQPGRVIKPDLKVRSVSSIVSKAKEIIKTYKDGKYESTMNLDKDTGEIKTIESREAVFYVNSVKNIIDIIKGAKLTPDECNILCSQSDADNKTKLRRRLGKGFDIGSIPVKGEPHKMFTFCTRTVYLGADFYSTNARTFIMSDANVDTLAVDISLDLPQILGRQRLNENPWKNRAEFYYKTLGKKNEKTEEVFNEYLEKKIKKTQNLLNAYRTCIDTSKHDLAEKYQSDVRYTNYKSDYVAVDKHAGADIFPVFNKLVMISEKRAFEIQQIDYKDRFSVFNSIEKEGIIKDSVSSNISNFLEIFDNLKGSYAKLKYLCNASLSDNEKVIILDQIPLVYKKYYEILGPEKCRSLGYDPFKLNKELVLLQFNKDDLKREILLNYNEGDKFSKSFIKDSLQKLYDSLNYTKKAKANDLETYFEIKECKVLNKETGKYEHGFELIKRKD